MSTADHERELLRDTVERLLAEHCAPERVAAAAKTGWDATAWRALGHTGLTLVGSPEDLGGSGGDLASAADIGVAAGAAAAPVPLTETLAAGMLLAQADLPIPPGPLTLAVTAHRQQTLCRVPYGRLATMVAVGVDEGGEWLAVAAHPVRVRLGRNMAGEPRDDVSLGADTEVRGVGAGTADYAQRLRRLFRSLLIRGRRPACPRAQPGVRNRTRAIRPIAGQAADNSAGTRANGGRDGTDQRGDASGRRG
jgi:hypothetical protein